jgi:hypothetical protein
MIATTDQVLKPSDFESYRLSSEPFRLLRFEVFTAVTMKNGVLWDVTPCGSCKNRRFGGTQLLLHQGDENR